MRWRKPRDPSRQLARLGPGARAELYRLLSAPSETRANVIGQLYSDTPTQELADILIEVEADPVLRLEVLRLLRDSLEMPSG